MKEMKKNKKTLYIDMDGVICDFVGGVNAIAPDINWDSETDINNLCKQNPNIFLNLTELKGAKEAIDELKQHFDIYFASTPMWGVPQSYMDKRLFIHKMFKWSWKRLILTHNKGLLHGDFLIDDRIANGVANFQGEHIHFGTEKFPNWDNRTIVDYLIERA